MNSVRMLIKLEEIWHQIKLFYVRNGELMDVHQTSKKI